MDQVAQAEKRRLPVTLLLGGGLIAACMALLAVDVAARGGAVLPDVGTLPRPQGSLGWLARLAAANMTVLCWVGYLLLFDGLLTLLARVRQDPAISSIRARPNRFLIAWLTSIPVWCFFDTVNFYAMHAWRYHGLPPQTLVRFGGYFIAFAAISPGMFMAAQWFAHLGLERVRTESPLWRRRITWLLVLGVNTLLAGLALLVAWRQGLLTEGGTTLGWVAAGLLLGPGWAMALWKRCPLATSFAFGAAFTAWSIVVADPVGNMTLWVGLIFLLDPLNKRLGAPSLLDDWLQGRWGRWLALMAGGALCGLLWELWNYWAVAKWTYDLPFLGAWEQVRYFEMPLAGFLGFLPFAMECWVMLNTIVKLMEKLGLRVAEPLPQGEVM